MQIFVFGQPKLARWSTRPFHVMTRFPTDRDDVYELDAATEPPGAPIAQGPFRRAAASIMRYEIFPPSVVRPVVARTPIALGDTIGIHFVRFRPVRLFFAARVVDVFDAADMGWHRAGFTYRTLVGHPELGEETFGVEKELATGRVRIALRSWSRPGTTLAKLGAPLARRMQVDATNRACAALAAIARDEVRS